MSRGGARHVIQSYKYTRSISRVLVDVRRGLGTMVAVAFPTVAIVIAVVAAAIVIAVVAARLKAEAHVVLP